MIVRVLLMLCLITLPIALSAQVQLTGKVVDAQNKGIAFVSLGIIGTQVATTSSFEGAFTITIPRNELQESLTFQVPGFETRSFPIDSLQRISNITIVMQEQVRQLATVAVLGSEKLKTRTKGNKGLVFGALETSFFTQRAYGIVTKAPGKDATLESIQVHVTNDSTITFIVRPFAFPVVDGNILQDQGLIPENKHFTFTMKKGWLTMDLSDMHIEVNGQIAFGLEWLKIEGEPKLPMASISLAALGGASSIQSSGFRKLERYNGLGAFAIKARFQYFD